MMRKQIAKVNNADPKRPVVEFQDINAFKDDLNSFKDGTRIWVTLEKHYNKRSLSQNSTIHWYIHMICEETGHDEEFMKEFLAKKYLTVSMLDQDGNEQADPETGEVMTRVRGTSELNVVEFMMFMDKIWMWANDFLGMQLPQPDPEMRK